MRVRRKVVVDLLSYTGRKGGTDVYIKNLYEKIGKQSHEFEFFGFASRDAKYLDTSWFPGSINYSRLGGNSKISWAFAEIFSVNKFARKIRPDFIHCPANFGPLRSNLKMVLTLHDALYWSKPHLAPNKLLLLGVRFMQKFTTRSSTAIITDSLSSSADINEYMGIPFSKIFPVYLGAEFKLDASEFPLVNRPYFLSGGNRFRHKNWSNLLKAWTLIDPKERPNLIITGGGAKDPLVRLVEEYSLTDSVELLNWVPEGDLENLYMNADAVIIPSLHEGFSLSVMQAMMSKKPLIASDIPVHKELAAGIAHFFNPNIPESIASAVVEFTKDSSQLEARRELGFKKSLKFSWEKCAVETLTVFNQI